MVALTQSPLNESYVEPSPYAWLRTRAPVPTSYAPACDPLSDFDDVLKNRTSRTRGIAKSCTEVVERKFLICIEIWQVELEDGIWRASFHKYGYVHNNPINSIDPTGLFSLGGMLGGMAIGGGIGGLSGAAIGGAYAGFTGKMTMWQGMWQGAIIGAMLGSFIGGGIGVGAVGAGGMIGPAVFNILRGFPAASYAIFIAMSESRQNGAFLRNQERELDDHLAYVQGRIFGGNSRSRDIVAKLAPKINNNAAGVAPELLASVMLGELYHMNILDTLFDDPNNPNRSVGYAQINARTIIGHNHPELAGKSASEIGNSLLNPEKAVDILSYEIRYYASKQMGTSNASLRGLNGMWNSSPGSRETIVSGMSSAKDTDMFSMMESNHTGQGLLGIEAYNDLKKLGVFSR